MTGRYRRKGFFSFLNQWAKATDIHNFDMNLGLLWLRAQACYTPYEYTCHSRRTDSVNELPWYSLTILPPHCTLTYHCTLPCLWTGETWAPCDTCAPRQSPGSSRRGGPTQSSACARVRQETPQKKWGNERRRTSDKKEGLLQGKKSSLNVTNSIKVRIGSTLKNPPTFLLSIDRSAFKTRWHCKQPHSIT